MRLLLGIMRIYATVTLVTIAVIAALATIIGIVEADALLIIGGGITTLWAWKAARRVSTSRSDQ